MVNSHSTPLQALKEHFGYDSFRPLQEEIVENVLSGHDSLVLMPTGGGKSLCYQLPAVCLPGMTLVVSPLIALMKDQVDALNANGIGARFINSSLTSSEIELAQAQASRGRVRILYVAPERLAIPGFRRFLQGVDLSLIAVDEAHCISEWGHEFRPDYRNLRQLRGDFPGVPTIALTATATTRVREDIVEQLGLQQGKVFLSSFNRANLTYSVENKEGYWGKLLSLLQSRDGESAIIYCFSRRETEELADDLNERGMPARAYHAGLDPEVRRRNQEDFIRDRVPIIVATIAFGMGIDKPDIRLVVHHSLPKSLEGYYQETGRAGRDGLPSHCALFYSYADRARQEYFINQLENRVEQQNAYQKLNKMVEFAEVPICRRKSILTYFGEYWEPENCGACDVCLSASQEFDATEVVQKVLSAVIRTGERFGAQHVAKVLRGSREKRVLELGHERLSVHGIVNDFTEEQLREVMGQLRANGLLVRNEGEYTTLSVSSKGREFLNQRRKLALPRLKSAEVGDGKTGRVSRGIGEAGVGPGIEDYDPALFEELRALRRQLADEQDVPPFVVFNDVALRYMAAAFPQSLESFGRVPGVGSAKLEQYGDRFVAAITTFAQARGLADRTGEMGLSRNSESSRRTSGRRERQTAGRSSTYEQTRQMLSQGLTIGEIASQRGLAHTTIIGQIERMAAQGQELSLEHLLPSPDRLQRIKEALDVCGDQYLKPLREYLGQEFEYDELRLSRLVLREMDRNED
ncbi:MAG: DNA helicase RecQ [Chloroflexi bacterium]|nr:DNA helicase RecQ [Chloroflexota bacterium]